MVQEAAVGIMGETRAGMQSKCIKNSPHRGVNCSEASWSHAPIKGTDPKKSQQAVKQALSQFLDGQMYRAKQARQGPRTCGFEREEGREGSWRMRDWENRKCHVRAERRTP